MHKLTVSVCLTLTHTQTHTQSTLGSTMLNSVFLGLITNAAGAQGRFK